jgi:hypothetical protein
VWPIGSTISNIGKGHRINHESHVSSRAPGGEALRERCQTAHTESNTIIFTACTSIRRQKQNNAGNHRNNLKHIRLNFYELGSGFSAELSVCLPYVLSQRALRLHSPGLFGLAVPRLFAGTQRQNIRARTDPYPAKQAE